jgi:hypothetical protein
MFLQNAGSTAHFCTVPTLMATVNISAELPLDLKSELNNPLTEDLRFKFLFVLLCAAPTTVIFVVKIKLKVQFTLEQTTKAQKWSKGIVLLFL